MRLSCYRVGRHPHPGTLDTMRLVTGGEGDTGAGELEEGDQVRIF